MKIFAVIAMEAGFKEKTTHHIDGERRDMEDDAAPDVLFHETGQSFLKSRHHLAVAGDQHRVGYDEMIA